MTYVTLGSHSIQGLLHKFHTILTSYLPIYWAPFLASGMLCLSVLLVLDSPWPAAARPHLRVPLQGELFKPSDFSRRFIFLDNRGNVSRNFHVSCAFLSSCDYSLLLHQFNSARTPFQQCGLFARGLHIYSPPLPALVESQRLTIVYS